jgi:16S rRNA (uracil1498-N3)-methyltransferase
VDLVIPTLERAALEEAVRAATIGGVQRIIITRTQKSAPLRIMRDRLTRCMIAAAEQSKQYCLPEIIECSDFDTAISKKSTMLFFHPTGSPLRDLFPVLESADPLTVVIGPAGDFTADEYDLLITKGACIARLTPTILRSEDAVMVGIGVVRSAL